MTASAVSANEIRREFLGPTSYLDPYTGAKKCKKTHLTHYQVVLETVIILAHTKFWWRGLVVNCVVRFPSVVVPEISLGMK